jgi:hypothetical protein
MVVGVASVGADLASPGGYALRTGKPVISNHLENEQALTNRERVRRFFCEIFGGDFRFLVEKYRGEGKISATSISY